MASQTERAYEILKARIVSLDLPPGSVLKETELMRELGLGRTPVREALQRLARDDLVMIQPRRGMYVADVRVTDLKHIFEARLSLEPWCARLAAERITDKHLNEMERAIQFAEDHQGIDFVDRLIESDRLIHAIVSEATGNRFLIDGVRWLYDLAARIWRLTSNPAAGSETIQHHHRELLEALRQRDQDRAEAIMRSHVLDSWNRIRAYI